MYKVPEFKISDFVESLPIKVKFLNSADSRPKHPDNAALLSLLSLLLWAFATDEDVQRGRRLRDSSKGFS